MLILDIINVLKCHSAPGDPLIQAEILKYLETDFGIRPDRKTLRTALNSLIKQYAGVGYSDSGRKGWYFKGILTEDEFDLVMRALLLSPEVGRSEIGEISEKLAVCTRNSRCFAYVVKPVGVRYHDHDGITELFELISQGIKERRMLIFSLCVRKGQGYTELEREPDGYVKEYLVRPISVLAHNGGFSLLGSIGDSGKMKFFPFSRMYGVRLTDVDCRVMPDYPEGSAVYPANLAEERYPCGGARERITVRATGAALFEIQEAFSEVIVQTVGKDLYEVSFLCNISSARRYIIGLGEGVEVVSPASLRREMAVICSNMAERYRVR